MEKINNSTEKLAYDFAYRAGLLVGGLIGQSLILEERLETEKHRADNEAHLARHDPLTGLLNRRGLEEKATELLNQKLPIVIYILDVYKFKFVNDTHGHETGDKLLQSTADTLLGIFRCSDAVGRIGGDEFGIVADMSPRSESDQEQPLDKRAQEVAHRLQNSFHVNALANGVPDGDYGISVGYVIYDPTVHENLDQVFKEADDQMYLNKHARRANIIL